MENVAKERAGRVERQSFGKGSKGVHVMYLHQENLLEYSSTHSYAAFFALFSQSRKRASIHEIDRGVERVFFNSTHSICLNYIRVSDHGNLSNATHLCPIMNHRKINKEIYLSPFSAPSLHDHREISKEIYRSSLSAPSSSSD